MSDMPNTHYVLENRTVFLAACILSAIGALVFNAFPLFLSTTADQFGFGLEQIGFLGSIYLIGFAAAALIAPFWMVAIEWRTSGIAAALLALSAIIATGLGSSAKGIYAAYALLGSGSGIVFTIGLTILARARDPEAAFGTKLMWEMGLAGLVMFLMTKLVIARFGYAGFVTGTFTVYLVCMALVMRLPENFLRRESRLDEERTEAANARKLPAWVAIAALFIQFAAFSALWGFMERIGGDNGLEAGVIGTVLTLSIVAGFAGAALAAWLGNRHGHILPLVAGLISAAIAAILLGYSKGLIVFVVGACVINAMLQYTVAYQMGLVAHNDYSGRIGVMIPFILAASAAVGPGVAGTVAEARGFGPVFWGFVMICGTSIALTIWVGRQNPVTEQ